MTDAKTYIELPSGDIELDYLLDNIRTAREDKWEYRKWFPRPALVDKNGGNSRLYTGQRFDEKFIDLKEEGWTHDHCDICLQTISDSSDRDGYFNGSAWICKSCFNLFIIPIDIEAVIGKLKKKLK